MSRALPATPLRLFGRDNSVGVARCQGEIQRGWSWCARRMSADDPSTRFMSMSRKTNKYFLSGGLCWRRPQPVPQNPRLSAPSRRNRVAILRSRNRRRSPPGGRWADLPGAGRAFVQVDRVARHRPPAPASPVPVRLCRLRRTQTIEAEAVTPVGEVTTTDDTIMQPAPSP